MIPRQKNPAISTANHTMLKGRRNLRRESPRSELKYFCRVAMARRYSDAMIAVVDLSERLLQRGQAPRDIAHDLSLLARHGGFSNVVAPIVNDLAMRGAAA